MQTQYDIFISYSDKDRELAQRVYEALKAEGLKCWIAFNDIPHGEVWAKAITQGIKNSKTFLLILSNNSNSSDQVLREIEYADKQKKKLYCYKVENLVVSDAIDYFISSIQQFEAQGITFEKAIERILSEFIRFLEIEKNNIIEPQISNIVMAQRYFDEGKKFYDENNYQEALMSLFQAANLEYDKAQTLIGQIYFDRFNPLHDYKQAYNWYLRAANNGNSESQASVGMMLHYGLGTVQNRDAAFDWLQKAANQGNVMAQENLQEHYQHRVKAKGYWKRLFGNEY